MTKTNSLRLCVSGLSSLILVITCAAGFACNDTSATAVDGSQTQADGSQTQDGGRTPDAAPDARLGPDGPAPLPPVDAGADARSDARLDSAVDGSFDGPQADARHDAGGVPPRETPPWFRSFVPTRVRFVSSSGSGTACSRRSPCGLTYAISSAAPGDAAFLRGGTYIATIDTQHAGTAASPILWRSYPGEFVTIRGLVDIDEAWNWVWGMEITDPSGAGPEVDAGCRVIAEGGACIHNWVHRVDRSNCLAGWNRGSGQVFYGNVA